MTKRFTELDLLEVERHTANQTMDQCSDLADISGSPVTVEAIAKWRAQVNGAILKRLDAARQRQADQEKLHDDVRYVAVAVLIALMAVFGIIKGVATLAWL